MSEPRWIDRVALELLHAESIAEHGGSPGLRDEGLLQSALARRQNLFAYEECSDLARLAASYGFGLAKNHAFVDGNKRAALLAIGLFLMLNGQRLSASQSETYDVIMRLAAGEVSEAALADWIRGAIRPR